jgi:hypothetical protein
VLFITNLLKINQNIYYLDKLHWRKAQQRTGNMISKPNGMPEPEEDPEVEQT